jgi:chemotaxis protein CheD
MVKKLMTQQDPVVVEREKALVQRTPEERAERLAKARARVELFSNNQTAKPRAELFTAQATKPRVELFKPRGLKTAEEA